MIILVVIPVRSGSKSIKDKNIRDFCGKPLLVHTMDEIKKSRFLKHMRIIVSTDSPRYKEIAEYNGVEVPFLRPKEISQDDSIDYELFEHALTFLEKEGFVPDIVLHLRVTQPLRTIDQIDEAIEIFWEQRDKFDSLRSVTKTSQVPYKMHRIIDGHLVPLFRQVDGIKDPYNTCRQYLPEIYQQNASIDIFNPLIVKQGTISGQNILPFVMEDDNVDIDTEQDWEKAEEMYKKRI